VNQSGLVATIAPFERETLGQPCLDYLAIYEHTATLRFDKPGTAWIIIRGQRKPEREIVTFTRRIMVE
jgi:hypothetical protein